MPEASESNPLWVSDSDQRSGFIARVSLGLLGSPWVSGVDRIVRERKKGASRLRYILSFILSLSHIFFLPPSW